MMDRLKNEKFDIALGQLLDQCFYGVVKRIGDGKLPYIVLSSAPLPSFYSWKMGLLVPSSFVPGDKTLENI